jgi:hypothetical protein
MIMNEGAAQANTSNVAVQEKGAGGVRDAG